MPFASIPLRIYAAAGVLVGVQPSHGNAAFPKGGLPDEAVDEDAVSLCVELQCLPEDVPELVFVWKPCHHALGSEAFDSLVVVHITELAGDVALEHFDLLPRNLHPARVVANYSNDWNLVSDEGVKLEHGVTEGPVAVDDHHQGVGVTQLCTEGKASANTQRPKGTRIQPLQRSRWPRWDTRGQTIASAEATYT